jgi:hypothetical protein
MLFFIYLVVNCYNYNPNRSTFYFQDFNRWNDDLRRTAGRSWMRVAEDERDGEKLETR